MMKFSKGQSLFEVVGALAVISILIVGLISVTTTSIKNTTFSKNNEIANAYAQELTEWLRSQRDTNWVNFKANAAANSGSYCFTSLAWLPGGNVPPPPCNASEVIPNTLFRRGAVFTCFNGAVQVACNLSTVNVIRTSVSVTWTDGQGDHSVNFVTELTNWRSS